MKENAVGTNRIVRDIVKATKIPREDVRRVLQMYRRYVLWHLMHGKDVIIKNFGTYYLHMGKPKYIESEVYTGFIPEHISYKFRFGSSVLRALKGKEINMDLMELYMIEEKRHWGYVTKYISQKGYGFIRSKIDGQSYFVHRSQIPDRFLTKGSLVEFSVGFNERTGKEEAQNVLVMESK